MTTVTHVQGDTLPLAITLPEVPGASADLSHVTIALHVHVGGSSVEVPGTVSNSRRALFSPPLLDTLLPRVYRTKARMRWPDGTVQWVDTPALQIRAGA